MSHEFESGLFVSTPAWHGLGTVLTHPPTVEEAIKLSGLDWDVRLSDLRLSSDSEEIEIPARAVIRNRIVSATTFSPDFEDDETAPAFDVLGVVGPDYVPLQNEAAFRWFQPLIDSGDFAIEAAGSLRGGKRVWVLARAVGVSADVIPGDQIDQYLLLAHGHDGTLSIHVGPTTVRVVCQNTLSSALSGGLDSLVKIRHTKGATVALEGVRELVVAAKRNFGDLFARLVPLARVQISAEELAHYIRTVFEPGREGDETACPRIVERVTELFETGRGHEIGTGTWWNGFNAITEFLTHERGKSADGRVESQWFGEGARVSARALDTALRLSQK